MRETVGHFSIYGDFKLEEITAALGIQPTGTTPKGTWYEGAEHASRVAEWELHCPEELTMFEQVVFLLDRLEPASTALKVLAERYTADFNISGEGTEAMCLGKEIVAKLHRLGVNLNCFTN